MNRLPRAVLATLSLVIGVQMAAPASVAAQDDESPAVTYRKGVMQSFRHQTGAMRSILNGGVEYAGHVQARANTIYELAMMLDDIFPAGSGGEGSRALPAIWEDADAFSERVQVIQSAAAQLAEAAKAGDTDAVSEAMGVVGRSCRGCHTDFRAR